ncbi:GNAT family N-acetyltransferase [Terricaulis sp.]|uniref:GNAT family N-acetyltransferase n=1 Tax=Terricaulis sp. TaxID=2768686 RepID=UPI0037852A24
MTLIERLERACLEAWPAKTRLTRYGWEHCATAGRSGRVNSVWPLAWTDEAPLERAVQHAADWCEAQGVAPMFKLADGLVAPPALATTLAAAGYAAHTETLVMTRAMPAHVARPAAVELHDIFNEHVASPLREAAPNAADATERTDIVLRIKAPRIFALARREGAPAAVGMAVLTGPLLGVYLMRTAPWARRQGLARDVLGALMHWGATHEAATAYLQVEAANAAALNLYAHEGFAALYRYHYWSRT